MENEIEIKPVEPQDLSPMDIPEGGVKPMYIHERGMAFFPKVRERAVAEAYIEIYTSTGDEQHTYKQVAELVQSRGGKKLWEADIYNILQEGNIKEWITQELKKRGILSGWDKGRWFGMIEDHFNGKRPLKGGDLYLMKLVKEALSFDNSNIHTVTQINFMQG